MTAASSLLYPVEAGPYLAVNHMICFSYDESDAQALTSRCAHKQPRRKKVGNPRPSSCTVTECHRRDTVSRTSGVRTSCIRIQVRYAAMPTSDGKTHDQRLDAVTCILCRTRTQNRSTAWRGEAPSSLMPSLLGRTPAGLQEDAQLEPAESAH
ncbi:hypothetical protein PYCCODRAFT_454393 [Trametes coccinea BRFM310]|uniref:Uncharacterized protein n=1 Tax=Trametes coccinea (strain BRFM310) TaxID=1353009 RepID=A0A1Y2INR8_TRAC3|nr:hypothetical protein PYCCODRAFT_454393 [Trametes coccinea BRFM310]